MMHALRTKICGWLSICVVLQFAGTTFVSPAHADLIGFSGFSNNGTATISGDTLSATLTQSAGGEAGSVFSAATQNVAAGFVVHFTYTPSNFGGVFGPVGADGTAFVLQTVGTNALGGTGSDLGYAGISPSVAVALNIWPFTVGAPGNPDSRGTAFDTNGTLNPYTSVLPVVIDSKDPIGVTLTYNGTTFALDETLTDLKTLDSITLPNVNGNTDLTGILGGPAAYVGFTGGDGANFSTQVISDFRFGPAPASVPEPGSLTIFGVAAILAFGWNRWRRQEGVQLRLPLDRPPGCPVRGGCIVH
jgi:hypothetical protein